MSGEFGPSAEDMGIGPEEIKIDKTPEKPTNAEDLLREERSIGELPKEFSFSDEVKYGLLSLAKWSKESGKEVSGVLYFNLDNKITLKELNRGYEDLVQIPIRDLTSLNDERIDYTLKRNIWTGAAGARSLEDKIFVLLPENYANDQLLNDSFANTPHIVERGKKVLGSIHTHPSGNPPSPGDFIQMVFDSSAQNMKGVVGQDTLYVMVRTKGSSSFERDVIEGKDTAFEYADRMDDEIDELIKTGYSEKDATRKVLLEHCHEHRIGLYIGDVSENKFERVV